MTSNASAPQFPVLLVDDHPAVGETFRTTLASSPLRRFPVRIARGTREALEIVEGPGAEPALAMLNGRLNDPAVLVEMLQQIWEAAPDVQAAVYFTKTEPIQSERICEQILELSEAEPRESNLLFLTQPLSPLVLRQAACLLAHKWQIQRETRQRAAEMTELSARRDRDVQRARDELLAANHELALARDAAEAANRSKSEFLASVSHEIRTPMNAILGYAELLMMEGDMRKAPSERLKAINTIVSNGNHLLQVVNDILDNSKIEAGKFAVECIPCSPLQIVHEAIDLMQVRSCETDIQLHLECRGSLPRTVHSDPTRLRQILLNLLGNGLKFARNGEVTVRMDFWQRGRDGTSQPALHFQVEDNGIGMSPTQVDQLFQPFAQAESSTTREFGGTGLGLSICRRLTALLGGEIWVESEPGEGSCFHFTIDPGTVSIEELVPADELLATTSNSSISAAAMADVRIDKLECRVLLAEDGIDNQRLFRVFLTRAGAEVELVENGEEACRRIADARDGEAPFDLILLDMQMPVLDGYSAARRLRQEGCELPIIALTAHALASDREKCLQAGCDDYLTKPVKRQRLLKTIAAHLARRRIRTDCLAE